MVRLIPLALILILSPASIVPSVPDCLALAVPVHGPVVDGFAPVGSYAGHWGIDLAAPVGSPVGAPWFGTVTFAGVVDENAAVTIDHGGGLVTTVSYLGALDTRRGASVVPGETIGRSAFAHGRAAVHLSVRVEGSYVDPAPLLECSPLSVSGALALTG